MAPPSRLDFTTANVSLPPVLDQAVSSCRDGSWSRGLNLFRQCAERDPGILERHPVALSYYGYACAHVDHRAEEGLELCRQAAKKEFYQPEVLMNLARCHAAADDRERAVQVLDTGLRLCPGHRGLTALRSELGMRQRPALSFLPRSFFLNRLLGRWRHWLRKPPRS